MTENRIIRTYLTKKNNRYFGTLIFSSVFEMTKNRVIRTYLTEKQRL